MRTTYAVALAALLLTACGAGSSDPPTVAEEPAATPVERPTEVPPPDGEVTTGNAMTVIDDGDGAELCLGGVMESLPPQCGGPRLVGWDWAGLEGTFEQAAGTRWGDYVVVGTFDGRTLTPSSVVPAADAEPLPERDEEHVWHTPCPEPEGGWVPVDPATTTDEGVDAAGRVASRLPDFGAMWVDLSINPAASEEPSGLEWEMAMSDPRFTIVNVSVTEDAAGAEAAIREVWGGPLCVSEAVMTADQMRRIGREVGDLPGVLTYGGSSYPMEVGVVFDDGSLQAWVDQEYGDGVVEVSSALVPAG